MYLLPTAATPINFAAVPAILSATTTTGAGLYNGNISSMLVNIPSLSRDTAYLYGYRYDQLNRLVAMDAYANTGLANNILAPSLLTDYQERISYDPNGNIRTYLRNGDRRSNNMDNLSYNYIANTNKLLQVTDAVTTPTPRDYTDLKTQPANNYDYDATGNLIKDSAANINTIEWTVYGKIKTINKQDNSRISYTYDAAGNRISKTLSNGDVTQYVRDAGGNVMSVYTKHTATPLSQTEIHLYGSSRLGINNVNIDVTANNGNAITIFTRGNKFFELSNHLGNVLVTVSDKKLQYSSNNSTIDYYAADVVSANDYYPFGMQMPGRNITASTTYRYGFNGKEKDADMDGNNYDYGFRIYNPQIGRFLSVDPLTQKYAWYTPYQFAGNSPIVAIDLDGAEPTTQAWKDAQAAYYNKIKMTNAITVQNQVVDVLYAKVKDYLPGDNQSTKRISSKAEEVSKDAIRQFVWVEGGIDVHSTKVTILVPDADGNIALVVNTFGDVTANYIGSKAEDAFVKDRINEYFDKLSKDIVDLSKTVSKKDGKVAIKILGKALSVVSKTIKIYDLVKEIKEAPESLDKGEIPIIGSLIQSNPARPTDEDVEKSTEDALRRILTPKKEKIKIQLNSTKPVTDHPEDNQNRQPSSVTNSNL